MTKRFLYAVMGLFIVATAGFAQRTSDPFPEPIPATDQTITVKFVEFATIPDFVGPPAAPRGGGEAVAPAPAPPRIMTMLYESGTRRYFASDMNGKLFAISSDGKTVSSYLDLTVPAWKVDVQAQGSERGLQSFAFHPQFNQAGARGFGKFYTYTDTSNTSVPVDFKAAIAARTHDIVVLEWTAKTPTAATYDGVAPRELIRIQEPYANHNGGHLTFNPLATPASTDYGLLYMGLADGGSGGDPNGHAQNLSIALGKILRLDPLGTNSANGKYGIPASNPFANDGKDDTLGEIYAYGVRNP
jgi:glucose/arabinose dehydrogenase